MKNRTLTVIITSILLVMGLTSCSDLLTAGFETPADTNYCTISGHISNPESVVSRSAFPTLPDGLEYIVYAENIRTSDTIDGDVVEDSFAISDLTIGQTYVVHAEAYDSDENLVMEGTSPAITLSSNLVNIDPITLSASQTGSGRISLEINYTGERNLYIIMSLDNQKYDPLNFVDGVCLIEIDPVPAGTRNLNLCVWEGSLPLFQYTDKLSVYQNKCTDTWVNNSNNSGEEAEKDPLHKNEDGTADFILTDDILNFFEKTAIYVDTKASQSDDLGTFWQPFKTISKAFEYAQASSSTKTTIFIKNGSSEEINASTELHGKRWDIQAYKDIPGDGQGNATLTFTDPQAIVFCLFDESELSATSITFKGKNGYQSASDGGFVYIDSRCKGTFNTCSFTYGNSCGYGGAIANKGTCTLNGCTFSNNQAETAGGAIFSAGTLTISGTTTIQHNISDENKYEFLSFYGNLTLAGTLNFKDSERFEFHKGNVSYAASSVTLVEGLSVTVTGSGISKIPLYYDGDPSGSCFFTSDSISKAKEFFTVESPLEITDDGKIAVPTPPISLTCDGQTSSPETLDAALSAGGCSKITLTAGYTYDCTGGYFQNGEITLEVLGEGTATVNVKGCINLWSSLTFSAKNITFIGDFTKNDGGGLLWNHDGGSGACTSTFENCTFTGGRTEEEGGAIFNYGTLTLKNCSFSDNKAYVGTEKEISNDLYLGKGDNTVTLSGSTDINHIELNKGTITLSDDFTVANENGYITIDTSSLSAGTTVLTGGKVSEYYKLFKTSEGNKYIAPDGKLKEIPANTMYVDGTNGNDENAGKSPSQPYATLKKALTSITRNDDNEWKIWVKSNGTETTDSHWELYGIKADIIVTDDLYTPTVTTNKTELKLGTEKQIFSGEESKISFTGFTFSRQDTVGDGGIFGNTAQLTLKNCSFDSISVRGNGGVIVNQTSGSVTLSECSFYSLQARDSGGAIFNVGELSVQGCSFTDCTSSSNGGAIYNAGALTVQGCSFTDCNTTISSSKGGAIYNAGNLTLNDYNGSRCSFSRCIDSAGEYYIVSETQSSSTTFSGDISYLATSEQTNGHIYLYDKARVTFQEYSPFTGMICINFHQQGEYEEITGNPLYIDDKSGTGNFAISASQDEDSTLDPQNQGDGSIYGYILPY